MCTLKITGRRLMLGSPWAHRRALRQSRLGPHLDVIYAG